jgi:hypothetical protein
MTARMQETLNELRDRRHPDPSPRLLDAFAGEDPAAVAVAIGSARVIRDETARQAAGLDALLSGQAGGYRGLHEAYRHIAKVRGPLDSFKMWADTAHIEYEGRLAEGINSASWPVMLGDALHRRIVAEFRTAPAWQAWRGIVSSTRFNTDFRYQHVERVGGYGTLPAVNEGAPYQPLPTPTNDADTQYKPAKRGGSEDITFEMIANDDVNAFQAIVTKLGRSASATLCKFAFSFIDTNPTIFDGAALFAAGHNNTTTNPLNQTNFGIARRAMRAQAAYGDATDVVGIVPRYLLVSRELEELAMQLCSATWPAADLGAGALEGTRNVVLPIIVPHWTSPTAWYLVADTDTAPTIELGFVNNTEDPTVLIGRDDTDAAGMFNADKVVVKINHNYGGAVIDYRGVTRGNA